MRSNDLYIGWENFQVEHSRVKHPATIYRYNSLNINKYKDNPIDLIGLDIETNHLTSEIKLLGFYDGKEYTYYTENFLGVLFQKIKYANKNNISFCHWNKLDIFILYKLFLLQMTEEEQKESLKAFGKLSGKWNRETEEWEEKPIARINFAGCEFGILNIIRTSIQFYYVSKYKKYINKVWSFDIANLYESNLTKEGARFSYYSKVDKSAHLVNWNKFNEDKNYRENIVLYSNYLDARVCRDLGLLSQEGFKKSFGKYCNTLLSAGSLTRSAIVLTIYNYYSRLIKNKIKLKKKVFEEVKSISIINYYDEWIEKYGEELVKNMFCLVNETYSGGYIETLQYGYCDIAYMSDIASAYPSIEVKLWDLRNAKVTSGNGIPPHIENSYCFVRGDIKTPLDLNFSPITIKHPFSNITNIRGVGEYKASYLLSSRDLLIKYGCEFNNEFWINIETTGQISPFALTINSFLKLRKKFKRLNDSAQDLAKKCANSGYGIEYECTPIYKELGENIIKIGYRAGEFYNPIYASVITGEIRNKITETSLEIEKNGGEVLLIMTDSIFWKGSIDDIPKNMYRDVKTLGYFEKPIEINRFMCLGAGRYEYYIGKDKYKGKTRGISISELTNENGIVVSDFNWRSLVFKAQSKNTSIININTRILLSPPIVLNYKKYSIKDLGLIKTENRKIDIVAGKSKRIINLDSNWLKRISNSLIKTKPLYLFKGMEGNNKLMDFTLPKFRELVMKQKANSRIEKVKENRKSQNVVYRDKHKSEHNKRYREKYNLLRKSGFDVTVSKKYANKNYKEVYILIGKEKF